MNTGASPKRTTAEAELGKAEALGIGSAEALGSGAAEAALAAGGALGADTAAGGVATGGGGATGSAGSGSGEGAEAIAVEEGEVEGGWRAEAGDAAEPGDADATKAADSVPGDRRPETSGAGAAEALADADCAKPCACHKSKTVMQSPMRRNRSRQACADLDELTEDLTLGRAASVTGLATASTILPEQSPFECPHRPPEAASENSATRVAYAPQ